MCSMPERMDELFINLAVSYESGVICIAYDNQHRTVGYVIHQLI